MLRLGSQLILALIALVVPTSSPSQSNIVSQLFSIED
jgi:hypothetical protein